MENIYSFIGHREIEYSEELKNKLRDKVEYLILNEKTVVFYFGSRSDFDTLCLEAVTSLKIKYPHIKRVYIRAEFECIDENYRKYIMELYDETYFPAQVSGAGKLSYIKRNRYMIDRSDFVVFYYKERYSPSNHSQSGTKLAFEYAKQKNKKIINIFEI